METNIDNAIWGTIINIDKGIVRGEDSRRYLIEDYQTTYANGVKPSHIRVVGTKILFKALENRVRVILDSNEEFTSCPQCTNFINSYSTEDEFLEALKLIQELILSKKFKVREGSWTSLAEVDIKTEFEFRSSKIAIAPYDLSFIQLLCVECNAILRFINGERSGNFIQLEYIVLPFIDIQDI